MPNPRKTVLQRILGFRYLVVVNLVLMLFLGIAFGREYIRNKEIQADINALQTQAEELAARNLQLTELKTAFQTESFIEREARLKLGLKKPGEELVIVQDSDRPADDESLDPHDPLRGIIEGKAADDRIANPSKWWYYFFDKKRFLELTDYGNSSTQS